MATLQVKKINDALYKALGARAALEHRSISQEIIRIVSNYLGAGVTSNEAATEAFLKLSGTWKDRSSTEKIIKDIRAARHTASRRKRMSHVFD